MTGWGMGEQPGQEIVPALPEAGQSQQYPIRESKCINRVNT